MNILSTIAEFKKIEVSLHKNLVSEAQLEKSPFFARVPLSMTQYLNNPDKQGIIAEFKRRSPSKGVINSSASIEEVTTGYLRAGASALSVLTDNEFFGGSKEDLIQARRLNDCPILRKEFIIDPYQIIEAKSIGADAVLLIAAILTKAQVRELSKIARDLGLETIMEVHSLEELEYMNENINIVGVNNRNLTNFIVSLETSLSLANNFGKGTFAISESGIRKPSDIQMLRQAGYKGFLIGEQFMASPDPSAACSRFISNLKSE